MQSKWKYLKTKAIKLRRSGHSLKDVEEKLGIARSTLSGWFRNIDLTPKQKQILHLRWKNALIDARIHAVAWHKNEKAKRLEIARENANETLSKINIKDKSTLELALAILYLGEGSKKSPTTSMGNSDPLILKFFLKTICTLYNLNIDKIRFDLHLRADQDPQEMKEYWAKELQVSIGNFNQVSIDQRTIGKKTYDHYRGVCVVNCGNVAIQRKLVYLGRAFCERVIEELKEKCARSSIG